MQLKGIIVGGAWSYQVLKFSFEGVYFLDPDRY